MSPAKLVPELYCSNFIASLHFYIDLIGFSILYDRPEKNFAYLDFDGVHLMLDETPEVTDNPRSWWTAKAEKPYGRGINLQIEVSDVDAICQRLTQNQWPLFRPMEEKWYRVNDCEMGNRQFLVQDPDGYLLRFFGDLGERA